MSAPVRVGAVRVGAICLAAGASSRMGQPKASLIWRGCSYLECIAKLAHFQGCDPIVAIEGPHPLPSLPLELGVQVIPHPNWSAGQLSSIQVGCDQLLKQNPSLTHILLLTVDRPRILLSTLATLVSQVALDTKMIWQPRYQRQNGHPIVLPRWLAKQISSLELSTSDSVTKNVIENHPITNNSKAENRSIKHRIVESTIPANTSSLREILRTEGVSHYRKFVDVADPATIENIDRPQDIPLPK